MLLIAEIRDADNAVVGRTEVEVGTERITDVFIPEIEMNSVAGLADTTTLQSRIEP